MAYGSSQAKGQIRTVAAGVPVVAQWLTNPTRNHEVARILWLWCRLVATAPIQPLAWEPPYAAEAAQEIATTTTKNNNNKRQKTKRQKDKKRK